MLKGSAARRRAANGRGSPRGAGGRQRTSSRQPGARRRRGAVAEIGYRPTALEAVPEEEGGRGEAASGSCRSDPSWHASWHAGSFDVASIRRALPAAAPRRAGSFDVASIRKALPAAAPRRGSGGPRKVSSKRRSALRGALAKAELDAEDELCGALERAALAHPRPPNGAFRPKGTRPAPPRPGKKDSHAEQNGHGERDSAHSYYSR